MESTFITNRLSLREMFLLLFFICFSNYLIAQKINFKDRNLKAALLEKGYDFNSNKEIEISEIDTITKINISEKDINQLDDLIYFKSLKEINAMTNNIKNLDVFFGNNVIEELYVGENQLGKKLIIKNMKSLKGLYAFRNDLEQLEITGSENLKFLYLQGNLFKSIDVLGFPNLETLQLDYNKSLESIDVSNNKLLIQLYLNSTKISELNLYNNTKIRTLYVPKGITLTKPPKKEDLKPMPTFENLQLEKKQ